MRFDFKKTLLCLASLMLLLIFLPGGVVFACGGGSISYDGGGFQCSVGGGSKGTVTVVTVTHSGGGSGGGGGGGGHQSNTGSSVATFNQVAHADACEFDSYISFCHSTSVAQKPSHHGGHTTTTILIICNNIIVTSANIECDTRWKLTARVNFPGIPIDTRPYPATLNRYPTALRADQLETAVGSAGLAYAPEGGGSPTKPRPGDMKNIRLTLTLYPKTLIPPEVYLENIGWITLPIGQLHTFSWQLPSHPAAGGGPTAGAVGQLQELAQDMPLYTNYARAPYGLECELDWQEYTANDTWKSHSLVRDIPPSEVKNLPAAEAADTNGDGKPDAYWDLGIVIRRMNEAGSISDPVYAHSYSWGDVFYWAVWEAQGQITFP